MAKSSTRTDWSAEEIGFLAGGPVRASQAALARLMDGGLVRVSREGHVTAVHQNGYGATTRLEAGILTALQGSGQPMAAIVAWTMRSAEMASLRQSLVDRGLVRRRGTTGSTGVQVILIVLTVLFFGIGFAEHAFWAPAAVTLLLSILVRRKGPLTPLGRSVLKYAQRNAHGYARLIALRGFTPSGRRRSRSTSNSGGWYHTADSGYVYSCSSASSCSSSSCAAGNSCSSSGCSSSSCNSSSSCGSSSSCSSSSSSSCSSSSSSSCGSSSS